MHMDRSLAEQVDEGGLPERLRTLRRVRSAGEAAWFLGGCLTYDGDLRLRAELARLLDVGEIDWLQVVRLSNEHCLTPALNAGLQRKALTRLLPSDLRDYLETLTGRNRQRNEMIARQARELFQTMNDEGLRPALMKGCLSLFENSLDLGVPMMADIDALLPEEQFPLAVRALSRLGYTAIDRLEPHSHALTFQRAGELATVDLHRRVGPQLQLLSPADAQRRTVPLSYCELQVDGLCPTHRVLLLLMNYCLFQPQYRKHELPLRGFHDLAVIVRHNARSIDWAQIAEVVGRHSLKGPADVWFTLANRFLSIPVPQTLRGDRTASRYLRLCLLQLRFPHLTRAYADAGQFFWLFDPLRMDYRYGCSLRSGSLLAARLRHAWVALVR
jgi:hypothetical protein